MHELVAAVPGWLAEGRRVAMAVVLETWGSAPRRPGAMLAVADDGRMAGSVSGGCVEAAVVHAALEALGRGAGRRLDFDVRDDDALAIGLACGGRLAVLVAEWPRAAWEQLIERSAAREPVEIAWLAEGDVARVGQAWFVERRIGHPATTLAAQAGAGDELGRAIGAALAAMPPAPGSWALTLGGVRYVGHRHVLAPPPAVVLIGGGHLGAALARVLAALGWEATVIDPREAFARAERFPPGTRVVSAWPGTALAAAPPDRSTAVVALSHDPKLDDGALAVALSGAAFYVGALGGRRTAAVRRDRLARDGVRPEDLARLRAPIGLAIGAVTPEEIAVAVAAELVAAWRAGPGAEGGRGADGAI